MSTSKHTHVSGGRPGTPQPYYHNPCMVKMQHPIEYMLPNEIKKALKQVTLPRPSYCAGYVIPPGDLTSRGPVEGCHYDMDRKLPITYLCTHELVNGERMCQPWAKYAYMLLEAYAKGEWTDAYWTSLFPHDQERDENGFLVNDNDYLGIPDGWPEFAEYNDNYPNCPGFKYRLETACGKRRLRGNVIAPGFDVDPISRYMYTQPCDHNPCEPSVKYRFALYHAFATEMLCCIGYKSDGVSEGDPQWVLNMMDWTRIYKKGPYKEMIMNPTCWPKPTGAQGLWSPLQLVEWPEDFRPPQGVVYDPKANGGQEISIREKPVNRRLRVTINKYKGVPMVHLKRTVQGVNGETKEQYVNFSARIDGDTLLERWTKLTYLYGTKEDIDHLSKCMQEAHTILTRPRFRN